MLLVQHWQHSKFVYHDHDDAHVVLVLADAEQEPADVGLEPVVAEQEPVGAVQELVGAVQEPVVVQGLVAAWVLVEQVPAADIAVVHTVVAVDIGVVADTVVVANKIE